MVKTDKMRMWMQCICL